MEDIAALQEDNETVKETADSLTETVAEIHIRLMELIKIIETDRCSHSRKR